MRFSIIVPLHRPTPAFGECIKGCLALDHDDFEVIVVSDKPMPLPDDPRIIPIATGSSSDTSPAEKRDAGFSHSSGEAIAYLDDDAYPAPEWLRVAEEAFAAAGVNAIGGPGVTPPDSPLRNRVGGAVYESALGSGPIRYRFRPAPARVIDDFPAFNLIVRRSAVAAAGGWASTFYGGEDTHFCEALRDTGSLVHYEPRLVVFHHRRAMFGPHMRQIRNVGVHRGFFMRQGRVSSRRLVFLTPLAAVCGGLVALAMGALKRPVATATATIAAGAAVAAASPDNDPAVRALFPLAVVAHHAAYAWGMVKGLSTRALDR